LSANPKIVHKLADASTVNAPASDVISSRLENVDYQVCHP